MSELNITDLATRLYHDAAWPRQQSPEEQRIAMRIALELFLRAHERGLDAETAYRRVARIVTRGRT